MPVALMREPVEAYIALGANLGDARQTLLDAIQAVDAMEQVELLRASSLYLTAPMDSSGPDYINAVVLVGTTLSAPDLLAGLQALELAAGRLRPYRNAPRTLDLDILSYGEASIDSPDLTLPHPRMQERAFVLVPLAEIAPHRVSEQALHAVKDQAIARL